AEEEVAAGGGGVGGEDAGDNRPVNGGQYYDNKTKHHDINENHCIRCSDRSYRLSRISIYRNAGEEGNGSETGKRPGNTSARAKAIRHAQTGCRRSYSGRDES